MSEGRSTPEEYRDLDRVRDRWRRVWAYVEPADVWKYVNSADNQLAPHSARSFQKLVYEFGPLIPAGRDEV